MADQSRTYANQVERVVADVAREASLAALPHLNTMANEIERLRALVGDEGQPGWEGCSRAEAIRQANECHADRLKWIEDFDKLRGTLHARIAELEQQRDAVLALCDEAERDEPSAVFSQGGPMWPIWTAEIRRAYGGKGA